MDCCCPGDRQPIYGVYVNNFQSTRVSSNKNKFSFRTTAAASSQQSRVSQNSDELSEDRERELDDQLSQLEREYQRLKRQEEEIDHFERNRVQQLEEEVTFYEREINERTKDIEELNHLFRVKLDQRRGIPQIPQVVQSQMFFKSAFGGNDSTCISSIPPNA